MTRPRQSLLNVVTGRRPPQWGLGLLSWLVPGAGFAALGRWKWGAFWFVVVTPLFLEPRYSLAGNLTRGLSVIHYLLVIQRLEQTGAPLRSGKREALAFALMLGLTVFAFLEQGKRASVYRKFDTAAMYCASVLIAQEEYARRAEGRYLPLQKLKRGYVLDACAASDLRIVEDVPLTATAFGFTVFSTRGKERVSVNQEHMTRE